MAYSCEGISPQNSGSFVQNGGNYFLQIYKRYHAQNQMRWKKSLRIKRRQESFFYDEEKNRDVQQKEL